MKFRVNLLWKLLAPAREADEAASRNLLFNPTGGRSFVRRLGGDFRFTTTPVVLSPTDLFHAALQPTRKKLGFDGARLPYQLRSATGENPQLVNIALHRHGKIVCATVQLKEFEVEGDFDWLALQDIRKHKNLWLLARKALALALTGEPRAELYREPQVLPALHIRALEKDIAGWESRLVSVVTRHADVNDELINHVITKNKTHRIDKTLLLIDKQGIASYVPSASSDAAADANLSRFNNSTAMLELAASLRLSLRDGFGVSEDAVKAIRDPNAAIMASVSGLRIWTLIVQEFALREALLNLEDAGPLPTNPKQIPMPSLTEEASTAPAPHRILLVTVAAPETRALRTAITHATGRSPAAQVIDGFTYQNYGVLGDYELVHQISGMGSGGIDGSQESVGRSITAVKPSCVMMVGIAFGVDSTKQPIGTILVSKQIQMYELQRVNKDESINPRGDRVTASPRLLNWASHAETQWPEAGPKVQSGLILSGEKLIDNKDFRDKLRTVAPEAIGGEMEGSGLYTASQSAQVAWILIKAVCDWADGNKATDKNERQAIAARAAADFCVHLIKVNSRTEQAKFAGDP